ncbi:MAG: hypothetical protein KJ601_05775 [Nanoarchaeota archaeon]|nr:hypothetical protein [Nanoarchaeota archaeon]
MQYTITKKIAKHGSQSIIVIPRILESELKPGTIAKITIDVLQKPKVFLDTKDQDGFFSVIEKTI